MSADSDKCKIIREWPAPTNNSEVKSFLQTVQFNVKFMGGEAGEATYPELTEPLRALTKKYARFRWGDREEYAFNEMKRRLCSDKVLVPYDLSKKTRFYVDSSPVGTQATLCQLHTIGEEDHWRPVNHTSRPWTPAEAGYGQVERESDGICTGMHMNKMYTLGTHVEVVTGHAPLIPIYNTKAKPKQLRVDRHRTKLLPFFYNVIYEEGAKTPCDYGSRHSKPKNFTEKEIEDWCVETGTDIFVNRIMEDNLPSAITLDIVKAGMMKDKEMKLLSKLVISHNKVECQKKLPEYHNIFDDLTVIDGVVMKGNQLVIPKSLRADVIGLSHEGHQYIDKTLSLLRQSCWFPKMRKDVCDYVNSCLACLAAIPRNTPVPLEPNLLPERAWQNVHADFKGPIAGQYYFHVLIDQFSKYPEVDILTSTSFRKLRPKLDRIFSAQGIPETISADNGPPYPSHDMEMYAKEMGFKMKLVTPEDPQSNGFAEAFVKILCKLIHTATVEGQDPRDALQKYLMHYRATPHPTTGISPAEMLNNRKIRTKLPHFFSTGDDADTAEIRSRHDQKKIEQKKQFDRRRKACNKDVNVGDQIIIKQAKSTTKPPFDPHPYTVTQVDGNRVNAERPGSSRRRDKNSVKVVKKRPEHLIPSWNNDCAAATTTDYGEFDIEVKWPSNQAQNGLESYEDDIPQEIEELPEQSEAEETPEETEEFIELTEDDETPQETEECPEQLPEIDETTQESQECFRQSDSTRQAGSRPVTSFLSQDLFSPSNVGTGVGNRQFSGHSLSNSRNGAIFETGGSELHGDKVVQEGNKERCDGVALSFPNSTLLFSPEPCHPRALKKGDRVAYKGKDDDDEWFTCSLISRAGRAKGKYTMAWNIERDGIKENVDFERDVGEYRLIQNTANQIEELTQEGDEAVVATESDSSPTQDNVQGTSNMNSHLQALILAAMEREESK